MFNSYIYTQRRIGRSVQNISIGLCSSVIVDSLKINTLKYFSKILNECTLLFKSQILEKIYKYWVGQKVQHSTRLSTKVYGNTLKPSSPKFLPKATIVNSAAPMQMMLLLWVDSVLSWILISKLFYSLNFQVSFVLFLVLVLVLWCQM